MKAVADRGLQTSTRSDGKVEIIVIGGWLGSGKTTFLNRLLAHRAESFRDGGDADRVAVLVNDVGDVHLDPLWIKRRDAKSIELLDGCICCSIGDSLAVVLRDLVLSSRPPRAIFIEASGLAEPGKVAKYGDRRRVVLREVLVTVDVVDIEKRLADATYGDLARQQLAQASKLVLAKTDLVTEVALRKTHLQLEQQFPAQICSVPEVLDQVQRSTSSVRSPLADSDGPAPLGVDGAGPSRAVHATESLTWRPEGLVETRQLIAILESLSTRGVLRAKGICRDVGGRSFVLQLAGSLVRRELIQAKEPDVFALVVIYDPSRVDRAAVEAQLDGSIRSDGSVGR